MDHQVPNWSTTPEVIDIDDIELIEIETPPAKRRRVEDDFVKERSVISGWMLADDLIPFLEPGDLVEIQRDLFQHWIVFTHVLHDVAYCIHLSGLDDDINFASDAIVDSTVASFRGSINKNTKGLTRSVSVGSIPNLFQTSIRDCDIAQVRRDALKGVVNQSRCRINNSKDNYFHAYSKATIVERAFTQLGVQKYNLLLTNCEHFASWCRYGSKSSSQTTLAKTLATTVVAGLITGGCGMSMACTALATFSACKAGNHIRNRLSRRLNLKWY